MADFQSYDKIVDSAGTKDHSLIQEAVTALGLTGGSIYVRKGTYTESIVVPDSTNNLEIHCGAGVIVKASGADEALDVGAGFTNFKLFGGEWRGVSAAAPGIKIGAGTRALIEGAIVGSATAAHKVSIGVQIASGASLVQLRGCVILSPTNKGVEVGASCAHITIEGNQVHSPDGIGIDFLATVSRILCNDNTVNGAGSHGIAVRATDGVVGSNLLYDAVGSGIFLSGASRIAVANNSIYDPDRYGIEGDSGASEPSSCNVVGNMIYSPASGNYVNVDESGMIVTANVDGDTIGTQHSRLHAMTSDVDHQGSASVFWYTDENGVITELPIGAADSFLKSAGASSAPVWAGSVDVTSLVTDLTGANWNVLYINGSGEVTALALGAAGTVLRGKGASAAPAFESEFGTPAVVLGTAAAAGSATAAVRTDATIVAFDATAPVTQAFSDAASAGAAAVAARRDHRHGMPASVSSPWSKVSAAAGTATGISLTSLVGYRRYQLWLYVESLADEPNLTVNGLSGNYVSKSMGPNDAATDTMFVGAGGSSSWLLTTETANHDASWVLEFMHKGSASGQISFIGRSSQPSIAGGYNSGDVASITAIAVDWTDSKVYHYILLGSNDVS